MKKLLSLLFGACGLLYGVPSQAEVMCCPANKQCGEVCCPTKGCNADRTACATEECASGIIDGSGYCCDGYLLDGACVSSCPSEYGAYNGYCRYCPELGSGYGAYDGSCIYCPDIGSGHGAYNGYCVNCSDYGYSLENGYCVPQSCPALYSDCEGEDCDIVSPMHVDGEITSECCTAFGGHFLYGESFPSTEYSCEYKSDVPLCCGVDGSTWSRGEELSYSSFWNPSLQTYLVPSGCLQVQSDSVKEERCVWAFGQAGQFYSNYTANECKSYFERKYNADIRIEAYYSGSNCFENGYGYCLCSGGSVYVHGDNTYVSEECANLCASTDACSLPGYGAYDGSCIYCPDAGSGKSGYGAYNGSCTYCPDVGSGYGAYNGDCVYCSDLSGWGAWDGLCGYCSDYGYSVENGYCVLQSCPALYSDCEGEDCNAVSPMDIDGEITEECCTAFGGHFLYGETITTTTDYSCEYKSHVPLCCDVDGGNTWVRSGVGDSPFWNPYLTASMIPTSCLQVQSDSVKESNCVWALGLAGEFYSNYTANECKSYFERKYNADIRIETFYTGHRCNQNGYLYCLCSGGNVYVRDNPDVSEECANLCASTATCPPGQGRYGSVCRYCPDVGSGYGAYDGSCIYCPDLGSGYGAYNEYCIYCPDVGSGYGAYNGDCVYCSDYGYSVENAYCV